MKRKLPKKPKPKAKPVKKLPAAAPKAKDVDAEKGPPRLIQLGRPSLYKPEYVAQARKLCARMGATDADLADLFDVDVSTIGAWRKKHPDFDEACTFGKEKFDDRVERALAQSAVGYTHDDVEIKVVDGNVVSIPVRKHYPPNPVAIQFWLTNRRKKSWQNKQNLAIGGDEDNKTPIRALLETIDGSGTGPGPG